MRCVTGPVALTIPDELEDRTGYAFVARSPSPDDGEEAGSPDRITVEREVMPEDVTPEHMVAHQRARLEEFPDLTMLIVESEIRGVEVLASTMHATTPPGGGRYEVLFAAFRWPPSFIASIDYESHGRKDASAVFAHAVSSVLRADEPRSVSRGHVVRYAGDISLELPPDFRYPRVYVFSTPDEAVRLSITIDETEPGPADIESIVEIEGTGDRLFIEDLGSEDRDLGGGMRGREARWRVERRSSAGVVLEVRRLRALVAPTRDKVWASFLLNEPENVHFDDLRWTDLLGSIEPSDQVA